MRGIAVRNTAAHRLQSRTQTQMFYKWAIFSITAGAWSGTHNTQGPSSRISLSHPSHPSALPLTSLSISLNLSSTLFLRIAKLAPKQLKREKYCALPSVSKDRDVIKWIRLNHQCLAHGQPKPWFSHYLIPFTYHTAVSLCYAMSLHCFIFIFSCFQGTAILQRRRLTNETTVLFFCVFVSTLYKAKVKISGLVFKSRWCGYDIRLVKAAI